MHLYVTVTGGWKSATGPLAQETWQFGIRYVPTITAPDPIGALPSDNDVYPVAATINRNETNWTITGNWYLEMGVSDLDPADWLHDQIMPAVIALIGGTGFFSSDMYVTGVRVYPIGADGRVAPAAPFATGTPCLLVPKTDTVADGQVAGQMLPPQVAVVASLRTPQIGPGGRGRIFLPALAVSASSTGGSVNATVRANLAAAVANFLEDSSLDGAPAPLTRPCIVPAAQSAPSVYAIVSQVRVGSVFDTQRRRRRSVPETFSTADPVY